MFKIEPIRKRGYYRALKRGELWAKLRKSMSDMSNMISREMFNECLKPNPLISGIATLNDLTEPHEIKIQYGSVLHKDE